MSQSNFTVDSSDARTYKNSKRIALIRSLLLKVLSKASEGHFVLKENGHVIAEVGDPTAELRAGCACSAAVEGARDAGAWPRTAGASCQLPRAASPEQ